VIDHLFDEFIVVFRTLFVIAYEVPEFGLFVFECVVQLFDLTDEICFLR